MKNKKTNFSIPSKYLFLGLLLVCLILIFFSYATGFSGGPLKSILGVTIMPFEKGISYVTDSLTENQNDKRSRQELYDENAKLKQQIAELNSEIANQNVKLKELENLQTLLNLKNDYSKYSTTGARIIASDTTNYYKTFTIDKGKKDGIKVNMNVIAEGGLVGIVVNVGNNYAVVRSIIDDSSNVSASFISTSDNCIVSGSMNDFKYNGYLKFSNLDDDKKKVTSGDAIVTSNISDKFLPGIMIGYAAEISEDSNNLTSSGYVVPAVDFKHLSEVLVILTLKENYSEDGN